MSPRWLAQLRAAWFGEPPTAMREPLYRFRRRCAICQLRDEMLAAWKRKHGPPVDRKAREAKCKRWRDEAFGPITDEQSEADRQLLTDAHSGKGPLL